MQPNRFRKTAAAGSDDQIAVHKRISKFDGILRRNADGGVRASWILDMFCLNLRDGKQSIEGFLQAGGIAHAEHSLPRGLRRRDRVELYRELTTELVEQVILHTEIESLFAARDRREWVSTRRAAEFLHVVKNLGQAGEDHGACHHGVGRNK